MVRHQSYPVTDIFVTACLKHFFSRNQDDGYRPDRTLNIFVILSHVQLEISLRGYELVTSLKVSWTTTITMTIG